MKFFKDLYGRIKTISSFSDFMKRFINVFILIYKICIGHYGEKYWEEQRQHRKLTKEEVSFIGLKRALHNIEILNSTGRVSEALKKLKTIKEHVYNLGNKMLINLFENELEISSKETTLGSYPRNMTITLTNKCNLNCVMCFANESKFEINDKMFEEIKSILPYLKSVLWMGGESFLYKRFAELFEEASRHSVKQIIVTNGLLLNETIIDKILSSNVNVTFSVDGITKEVYEKIRVNGNFEVLLKNLEYLNRRKKELNSLSEIKMNIVIMKYNYFQTADFVDFCGRYGFSEVEFTPLVRDRRNRHLDVFGEDFNADIVKEIQKQIKTAEQKAKQYNIFFKNSLPDMSFVENISSKSYTFNVNICDKSDESLFCHIPWKNLFVSANGDVYPNCFCSRKIGNLAESGIMELWNSDIMTEYRRRIVDNNIKNFCSDDCIYGRISKDSLLFS